MQNVNLKSAESGMVSTKADDGDTKRKSRKHYDFVLATCRFVDMCMCLKSATADIMLEYYVAQLKVSIVLLHVFLLS